MMYLGFRRNKVLVWTENTTFTARNCGKVMFSQACVIPSVHGLGCSALGRGMVSASRGACLPKGVCIQGRRGSASRKGCLSIQGRVVVCIQEGGSSSRNGGMHPGRGVCIQRGVGQTPQLDSRCPRGCVWTDVGSVQEGCVQEVHTRRPRGRHTPSGPRGRTSPPPSPTP